MNQTDKHFSVQTKAKKSDSTKWMGISTAASVPDDAATPGLTRPQTSTGVGVSQLTPLAVPPQVSVSPALRTPCATAPERGLLTDRQAGLRSACGCERKEAPKIELKPHCFSHTDNYHAHSSSKNQRGEKRVTQYTLSRFLHFFRVPPRGGAKWRFERRCPHKQAGPRKGWVCDLQVTSSRSRRVSQLRRQNLA